MTRRDRLRRHVQRRYPDWIESATRWAMIAVVVMWAALAVLGNVDVDATARLFAAIEAGAGRIARAV